MSPAVSLNLVPPQYQYREISRCVRQWQQLKQTRQGGGTHSPLNLAHIPAATSSDVDEGEGDDDDDFDFDFA